MKTAVILMLLLGSLARGAELPHAAPEAVGMDAAQLARIDDEVAKALAARRLPGCVVLVARQGRVALRKAYGQKRLLPEQEAMTADTVFDLASLTKPLATALAVMRLVDERRVALADPVAQHLPEFAAAGKQAITLEHLLVHQGGLVADNHLDDYLDGPAKAFERLFALHPTAPPGSRFVYSDVGFLVLGELVHRASGHDLHQFTREKFYRPLGLTETGFLPDDPLRRRAAPTEQRDGRWLQGQVHDPRAARLGGVAGHAGLFSTADEVAVLAEMLLERGQRGKARVLSEAAVHEMTRRRAVAGGFRGLGWDMESGYSSNRGRPMSERAFGHGGFTGTSLWIDPQHHLTVIFLSNRVHPDGKGLVNPLAGRIGTIAVEAIRAR